MSRIFLIGMPGSGKSTVGKEVAAMLELPFFDLDKEIEEKEELSIPELFARKGEDYFRQAEQQYLSSFLQNDSFLLATGGGTPCFFDNMEKMNRVGVTLLLDVPVSVLAERLWKQGDHGRPLLQKQDFISLEKELERKRESRVVFYQKARLVLSYPDTSAEAIVALLRPHIRK